MPVQVQRIDEATVRFATPKITIVMRSAGPLLVATRARGHLDVDMARHMMDVMDGFTEAGRPTLFKDWSEMTGYDSEARSALTMWQLRTRKLFGPVHMLVTSRIVAMGVAVANVALGGSLTAYTERDEYEAKMRDAGLEPPPIDG